MRDVFLTLFAFILLTCIIVPRCFFVIQVCFYCRELLYQVYRSRNVHPSMHERNMTIDTKNKWRKIRSKNNRSFCCCLYDFNVITYFYNICINKCTGNSLHLTCSLITEQYFFELYAFIMLTSTLVLGINHFVIITRPLHPNIV